MLVDLGCGTGTFVKKFAHLFREVIAVDFVPLLVNRARESYNATTPASWHITDVAKCGEFLGICADLAVCLNVITSASAAKRKLLWSSVTTVTKPGGHLLLVVPALESHMMVQEMTAVKRRKPKRIEDTGDVIERSGTWQKHYTRTELEATLTALGLSVTRLGKVTYPWSVEGERKPRLTTKQPFDWICLARRGRA